MEIRKEYNVRQLSETLQRKVEESRRNGGIVKLHVLTACDILDVLQEVHRMEQKHQTIEGKIKLGEKENKLPECFGFYEEECGWGDDCDECKYREMCEKEQNKRRTGVNE